MKKVVCTEISCRGKLYSHIIVGQIYEVDILHEGLGLYILDEYGFGHENRYVPTELFVEISKYRESQISKILE